jgi:hypothetical protein
MSKLAPEFDELRHAIGRLRGQLESMIVRGLRACGADEIAQLRSFTEYLERAGAGHVAAILAELESQIEKDDRASAKTLLHAQIAVRLLERLLTLRIVQQQYTNAAELAQLAAAGIANIDQAAIDADDDDDDDSEGG